MKSAAQTNLKDVLSSLKSSKIVDRREALSAFATIFERPDFINRFHINSDGVAEPRTWLVVYQALFEAVLTEKIAVTKAGPVKPATSSATAKRRLEDTASTVRWLIEKTVHLMNKRVTKPIFEHLLQTLVHRGEIFAPVALHYIKALRCLASYPPHLEHLEDDTWIRMVEICFNSLLGDPIKSGFEDAHAEKIDDSYLFLDDEPSEHDEDTSQLPPKKRQRTNFTAAVYPPSSRSQAKHRSISQLTSVSHEQVEFMGLLSTLLRSTSSPILSHEYPHLASAVLIRLRRFLHIYTSDTSLLHDYILALSSTLSHLSLNVSRDVAKFARGVWDALLGIWGTKNKRIKEGLVAILRILIPFITSDNVTYNQVDVPFNHADGLGKLLTALNGEVDSRWGVGGLSLECLRLELANQSTSQSESTANSAFVARTFRYGANFDSNQALAWSILELQADCIAKLFKLSEAMQPPVTSGLTQGEAKRTRLENPIDTLLASIQQRSQSHVRAYNLQILLFIIDRHWHILHDALQQEVIQNLLQFVSFDDGVIQSWVFLCFSSIASAVRLLSIAPEGPSQPPHSVRPGEGVAVWDLIWTNAIRRTNVPTISRAACHTAYTILAGAYSQANTPPSIPLPYTRILFEIEALAKDIDVQGPPHPYDSVCAFLASCLKIASQDMHLYKMQLEEKVLTWLIDCWQVEGLRSKSLLAHTVGDIISLLESICGLAKQSNLISRIPLPEGQIVETLTEEATTKVIKDFVLSAHLPIFQPMETIQSGKPSLLPTKQDAVVHNDRQLPPRGRERRISAFLLKTLDRLVLEWDVNLGQLTAETARRTLDVAVTALSFETDLVMNGTQSDRRLIQRACTLLGTVVSLLLDARWTIAERALICLGLDPLISLTHNREGYMTWSAMLPPDIGSGIRTQLLSKLLRLEVGGDDEASLYRLNFLKILWRNADVQTSFNAIDGTFRALTRLLLSGRPISSSTHDGMDVDEQDGFGPTTAEQLSMNKNETFTELRSLRIVLDSCISFLTVGPALQSASGEPTRDRDLMEAVLSCATTKPEAFLLVSPIILAKNRQRILSLSVKNLDGFLNELSQLLQSYHYSRSHRLQLLATQLLDSTMDTWASPNAAIGEPLEKVRQICTWLSGVLKKGKIKFWPVREMLANFFDRYLIKDPTQHIWALAQELDGTPPDEWPGSLLPMLGADDDVRVRFRVAVLNAHLFAFARSTKRPINEMYIAIKDQLTIDLNDYERMLTRILSLGNVMVVGSAVRRGAYWHLLETCFHTSVYSAHIESVLRGVSQRLGLDGLSSLFEAYAAQLAYSIRQSNSDFLLLPPELLGYQDRKKCAIANFRAFTPTNIWNGGEQLFENHCTIIEKSSTDCLRMCFGDILGYQIVTWLDEHDTEVGALGPLLRSATFQDDEYLHFLSQNVDGVVAAILRTLSDQDFSDTGPIAAALQLFDQSGSYAQTFCQLNRFRKMEHFTTHRPNLPAFPAETILRSLQWLRSEINDVDHRATSYHVVHQLFASIDRSFLLNEQLRLINAICLWIAIHAQDFHETTLLHTLIHRTTSLLEQSDLAWSAQSILDWAFDCYRKAKVKHPRIPNILVRICCTAYDYSRTISDDNTSSLGIELLKWIDLQAYKLSQVPSLSSQVMRALPAWPHQPSAQLTQLCQSITGDHLAAVLEDHRLASSKFRLVRRLRDYVSSKDYDEGHFAQVDFWRLKQCIPPSAQLQIADIDAFADLLFMNKGRLDSFHSESHNPTSLLHRQVRSTPKASQSQTESAPDSIIAILIALVQGESTSRSDIAYQTLRLIKAAETEEIHNVHLSPSEHQAELDYLSKYKWLPRERRPRDLEDLVTTDTYLDLIGNYSRWVAETTCLFSDVLSANDAFYAQMIPILRADSEFAEQVLPILVYALLEKQDPSDARHREILSRFFSSVLSSNTAETQCLQSIIDIVLHLRHFQHVRPRSKEDRGHDALSYNKWLDISFTLLARCSITCGAYTTALLFLQLAFDSRRDSPDPPEELLYEIYRHIDEPDGFYGIHDTDLHRNLLKRFHHENQWERAFRFHGAAFEAGDAANHAEGLVMSFHSFGFDHLANDVLRTVPSLKSGSSHASHSMGYRLAWRTETWDLPECDERSTGASLYIALRAVHRERDKRMIDDTVRRCMAREVDRLRTLGMENFAEIREVVRDIMCLREIKLWVRDSGSTSTDFGESAIGNRFINISPDFDFSSTECIMAARVSLVRSARQQEERQQVGTLASPLAEGLISLESSCLVRLSQAARVANEVQIALNSIVRARKLEKTPSLGVFQEFANVLWCQKEEKIAVEYLDGLRQSHWSGHVRNVVSNEEKARLLSLLGSWTSSACFKKPDDIQQDYFLAAVELLAHKDVPKSDDFTGTKATVYHECAMFAEHQYYEIVRSPDAIRWKLYVDRKRQEIDTRGQELLALKPETQEYKRLDYHQTTARKLLTEDMELSRRHNKARDTYLRQAIDMYSSCLQISDAYDKGVTIRLCSLWFANFEDDEGGLQELVGTALERVPSHKFVFLSHQLTARISKPHIGDLPKHQSNLQTLVLRMCKEHPFHSLYQVYCLQADKAIIKRSVNKAMFPAPSERSAATNEIFERLRAESTTKDHLRDIHLLCDACLQWAQHPVKGMGLKSGRMVRVPKSAGISKISNLRVPVMTHHTPLDVTMQYNNCPWIDHYDAEWTVAGGKNSPKINTCIGSDGVRYKQLFKGEGDDDLRQDAVMEQVFDLVNDILGQDRETKKRLLNVRGYKVIPLASQAGLLEFVDNTLPLGEWLPSAHARYNPGEIPPNQIFAKLRGLLDEAIDVKRSGFMQLWSSVRPVMRHFFTEKHKTPISWFAMRLRYIRSAATTSIVGHILGLGDRHISNILIDNVSGQVIHIDLGIAFDQGKLLKVAELVPFRMTRDMVDGMGISGTSGVFHRCAEETLRVLRDSSEVIMTVLEVFKHDPLHSWSASETKLNRIQEGALRATTSTARFGIDIGIDMSSGTAEESADRALSSVSRKLDKSLSVQSAVNQLVREATDIHNFMNMWPGWGPLY